jgi:hypothetical protein
MDQEAVWRGEGGGRTYKTDVYDFRHCEYIPKSLIKERAEGIPGSGYKTLDAGHLLHCLDRLINFNTHEISEFWMEMVL